MSLKNTRLLGDVRNMSYKILLLSDIHGNRMILEMIKSHQKEVDMVVIAGDIDTRKHRLIELITNSAKIVDKVLVIPGNCDIPEHFDDLGEYNIHGRKIVLDSYTFIGIGGSPPTPFGMPFEMSENMLYETAVRALRDEKPKNLIVVSHSPPYKTKLDRVFLGMHVGSKAIRRFIEEFQPILCLCGHIHESRGIDMIGRTLIVNPGPARDGYYALVTLKKEIEVRLKRWR